MTNPCLVGGTEEAAAELQAKYDKLLSVANELYGSMSLTVYHALGSDPPA